jgi:hypothetical protein
LTLVEAVSAYDTTKIIAILGDGAREIIESADSVTAAREREVFVAAFQEAWRIDEDDSGRSVLSVGNEDWPFAIPIVKDHERWRFDTEAGKDEIFYRRIGKNEMSVLRVCRAYVEAQIEYASVGRDGGSPGRYAKTLISDAGKQNGLFWPTADGTPQSPLGPMIGEATKSGHVTGSGNPYHGYNYRILTAQGTNAPGGARDYIVNGEMTGGFGLVAFPAVYGESGIMTFVINQDGLIYEKDLGEKATAQDAQMLTYDPDSSWQRAE